MISLLDSISFLFTPLNSKLGLQSMLDKCILARTRNEEALLIADCLNGIRKKLNEPSISSSVITQCLTFVIFAKTLGYETDFANIHAVKLAQSESLKDKKAGYLACIFLLNDSHPLSLLLVNSIIRDLTNKNMFVISMALSGACRLIPTDQAPLVLTHIADKLNHSNEMVRSKAVIALHHFLSTIPESSSHFSSRILPMLGDKYPTVVTQVILYLRDLSKISPHILMDIAPALSGIQKQIIEDKLPKEYKYKQISLPWIQITILELLQQCGQRDPAVLHVLKSTLTSMENITKDLNMVVALKFQCILAILSQTSDKEFFTKAISFANSWIRSENSNFIYTGMDLLEHLYNQHKIEITTDMQHKFFELLDHPDHLIKRKAISILSSIANARNAYTICNHIYEYARDNCQNNKYLVRYQIEHILALISKYPDENHYWHLALLVRVLPLCLPDQVETIHHIIMKCLLNRNAPNIHYARINIFKQLRRYSDSPMVPISILGLYVWTLSHFHTELEFENEDTNDSAQTAIDILAELGLKIFRHSKDFENIEIPPLLTKIVCSIKDIVMNSGQITENVQNFLHEIQESSIQYVHLKTSCEDTLLKIKHAPAISKALNQINRIDLLCEDDPSSSMDLTLSFLDDFVYESLEKGDVPYMLPVVHQLTSSVQNLLLEDETFSSSTQLSSPHSSGRGSIEIHSPCDGGSFSGNSQIELAPAVLTWSKAGRIKEDLPPEENSILSERTQILAEKFITNQSSENPFEENQNT